MYLVAAGLLSKGVWFLEQNEWVKIAGEGVVEAGSGPGSYDIRQSVWHVNCCNPNDNGNGGSGWGIFHSLFGWQNSATYGSVISYNLYWLVVIVGFLVMGFREKKAKAAGGLDAGSDRSDSGVVGGKNEPGEPRAAVREVEG